MIGDMWWRNGALSSLSKSRYMIMKLSVQNKTGNDQLPFSLEHGTSQ